MDLFDVVRACFRRWYVLVPILVITAFYSHSVYAKVQPVYYAQTVLGIAPPSSRVDTALPGQPVQRNGLLDIGGAPFIANMAALALAQPTVVNRVVAGGGDAQYNARMFPVPEAAQQIPLVLIDAVSPDPEITKRTLELAVVEYGVSLESLQRDARVPQATMVEPFVVSAPGTPVAAMPSRTKSTLSVAIAGVGLGIVAAVIVDVFFMRRRRRRDERRAQAEACASTPTPAVPGNPAGPKVVGGVDNPETFLAEETGRAP